MDGIDLARLQRVLELHVEPLGCGQFRVAGRAEPHHVNLRDPGHVCDWQEKRRVLGLPDLLPFAGIGADKCRENAPAVSSPCRGASPDKYELERLSLLADGTQRSYASVLQRVRAFFDRHHPGYPGG